jgi:hypothetical protein
MAQANQDLQAQLQQAAQVIGDKNADRQFEMQKKQMELENQYRMKELDLQFQMQKLQMENQFKVSQFRESAIVDVMSKKAIDQTETENNVKEYGEKKVIDLMLTPPEINIIPMQI